MTCLAHGKGLFVSSASSPPYQVQEPVEFLDPAPAANPGPRRRGRWAQPGVELSVHSMLDLRQLETLAPSPRTPSQDSLATSLSGPGKNDRRDCETSHASQVSRPSLSCRALQGTLASLTATAKASAPCWVWLLCPSGTGSE